MYKDNKATANNGLQYAGRSSGRGYGILLDLDDAAVANLGLIHSSAAGGGRGRDDSELLALLPAADVDENEDEKADQQDQTDEQIEVSFDVVGYQRRSNSLRGPRDGALGDTLRFVQSR
ncbi:hypothetical protein PMAYCL1PPCAC_19974, partial [Pristionchus mayeri]